MLKSSLSSWSFCGLLLCISLSVQITPSHAAETEQSPPKKTPPKEELRFPELETGPCSKDSDCDYNYKHAMDNGRCCAGTCSPKAVTQTTTDRIEAYCKKAGYDHANCPTKKCREPAKLRCVNKVCQLKK